VRGEGRGIVVVWGSGCIGGPVLEEHVPSTVSKGLAGFSHELGEGNFCSRWREGVEDQGEECEAFLKREGEVRKCVNREVFP